MSSGRVHDLLLLDPGDAVVMDRPSTVGAIQIFCFAVANLYGRDIQTADMDELEDLILRYRPSTISHQRFFVRLDRQPELTQERNVGTGRGVFRGKQFVAVENGIRAREKTKGLALPRKPGAAGRKPHAVATTLMEDRARRTAASTHLPDEDNARAYLGLSTVFRRLGDNQQTVDAALRAIGLLHRLPLAHFNLGVALARSVENERATLAFETALRFQPEMVNAHRYLATIHRMEGGDAAKAAFHRGEVLLLTKRRSRDSSAADAKREQLFDLPEIPKRAERLATLLKERPDPKPEVEKSGKTFVLVSGLPRSGTSLMMQLLEAGRLPPMTDSQRVADVDNPRGYYEWEAIKQIGKKPDLLDDEAVEGRAIKCISMLLPQMPARHQYKVIFMARPVAEVVSSQKAMTARLGTKGAELEADQLERGLRAHREEMRQWGTHAPHFEWCEIDYPALVRDPAPAIARLVEFLGPERLPNEKGMAAVIDPSLHRRKAYFSLV